MQNAPIAVWSIPNISVAFFPSLKKISITYRSFKVSDCIFEIHQRWQSCFSWVYSNSCCTYWFEPEIIKTGRSSHKMYSNNILNFQESTIILNAHSKKVWKHIICTSHIYTCPWYNGYHRRKWTRGHEFKSWTRLIAFHIALIPLGKVWIQLFSLQLWLNSRAD